MTTEEWTELTRWMRAYWPHADLPDETLMVWYDEVADLRAEDVFTAARGLARAGGEWPPSGGALRVFVAELGEGRHDWSAAYKLACLEGAPVECRGWLTAPVACLEWLEGVDPLAAESVRRYGIEAWGERLAVNEGTSRAQFRDIYKQAAQGHASSRALRGLPAVHQLDSHEPRQITAASALPTPPPPTGLEHEEGDSPSPETKAERPREESPE